MSKWEAIDLFSGCGGFSHGIQAAGIKIVVGSDYEPATEFPFKHNHKDAEFYLCDIRDLDATELSKHYSDGAHRLLIGGPPCQPYSQLGKYTWKDLDKRTSLQSPVMDFVRLAGDLDVDAVVIENVTNFAKSEMFPKVLTGLQNLGFNVEWKKLWMYHFGVPQSRHRMFVVATKPHIGFTWPTPITRKTSPELTLQSFIGDLPYVGIDGVDKHDRYHRDKPIGRIARSRLNISTPGGSCEDWPLHLLEPVKRKQMERDGKIGFSAAYGRIAWDALPPTMIAQLRPGCGRFGHPDVPRLLTMREAARLQTFPDEFEFVPEGYKWSNAKSFEVVYTLIGNAVPPRFASRLLGCLR